GTWLVMCAGKIYFTGISLARSRLSSADAKARRVAWLPVIVLAAAIMVVGSSVARALTASPVAGFGDLLNRLGGASTHGLSRVLLWPFMALAWPLFAEWPGPYLWSLLSAGIVLAAIVVWVLQSDHAFEEAAAEVAARRAQAR